MSSSLSIQRKKEILLYLFAAAVPFSFAIWGSLLNNFVIEVASFTGSQIGILQSIREIPGLLAFSIVFVLLFISQQRLAYVSLLLLGLATALTGYFPSAVGLYATTVLMSIGFHYMETLNQSLTLQWIDKTKSAIFLGKISATKSFIGLLSFLIAYVSMSMFNFEYKYVYLVGGSITVIIAIIGWSYFEHFEDNVLQERKLVLKKEYWLFYVLTFLGGARRQIFVVFAGFLLVEKFGMDVETMVLLLIVNAILNIYFAPKIGKLITNLGERISLRIEYLGLVLVFVSYALVESLYVVLILYVLDHLLFSMSITLKTYFQKIADPKDIASSSAISFTINHIAAVFLPVLLGLIWLQSSSLVFIIGSIIACFSLFLSFLIPKSPARGNEWVKF